MIRSDEIMTITIETRLSVTGENVTRASIHLIFGEWTMTVSKIIIKKDQENWRICMPVSEYMGKLHPIILFQGRLKECIREALLKDNEYMRNNDIHTYLNSRQLPPT
jgi:hypothetical protein